MTNGILIADDSEVFRRAVRSYLTLREFEICGEAIDGALVILDLRMPKMNGVEVASVLKGRMPDVRILLLTMYDEVLGYKSLMSAIGIDAMMAKTNCFKTLGGCVRGLLNN